MAFVPSFSTSITGDPSAIVLLDTSTGSDGAINSRQVLLYTVAQVLLVPAIPWQLATNPGTFTPLTKDYGLNVQVNWIDSGGTVLYTSSQIHAFTQYGEQFFSNLTRLQNSQPKIVNDTNFYNNKLKLRVELDSATQAIDEMADIFSAQQCIERYQYLIQNQANFF